MARIKGGMNARKKHNRVLKLAMLAEMAVNDAAGFASLAEAAKAKIA